MTELEFLFVPWWFICFIGPFPTLGFLERAIVPVMSPLSFPELFRLGVQIKLPIHRHRTPSLHRGFCLSEIALWG